MKIRPATKSDLLRIHEMDIESYGVQTTPITGLIWLVEKQGESPILFLSVGEEDGQLVGFIAWKEREADEGMRAMEILHLVVAKNYRHEGLGEKLLQGAIDEGKAKGLRGASMQIPVRHTTACHLLEKLGFTEYQRLPGYFHDLGDGVVYAKRLS